MENSQNLNAQKIFRKYENKRIIYFFYEFSILVKMIIIFILFILFFLNQIIMKKKEMIKGNFYLDKYETYIYDKIKYKLVSNKCSQMWDNQKEFLNGVIRKFRPTKILEIGIANGGGTSIILNAIQDINNAHLYSIDLSNNINIGKCVKNIFPEFLSKWTLYTGNIAAKFIEEIGDNIDMVFIDSAHFEPGEILDFLIVLPFLKDRAIVGFHDIANQITKPRMGRNEWAPYIIFNMIRGKPYFPSGNTLLKHDIGIKILDKNQNKNHQDYFRALGGQWQYFPKENHIQLIIQLFKKYYENECLIIFNETVEYNRKFIKNNPMKQIYKYNSDN